jgi:hypothetical protein
MHEMHAPTSQLKDVPIAKMRVSPNAQRDLRPGRVAKLLAIFDLEEMGYPVVNFRDGHYYIIDGNHRVAVLKLWLGGWEKQSVTCRVYSGLSEKEEAWKYLQLNNQLSQSAFDRFKIGVTACNATEVAVKRAVEKAGLKISRDKDVGHVSAVTTLMKIHARSDAQTLERALRLIYQSFGDPGLSNSVIDGAARVCERYNGQLNDKTAIEQLQSMRGGVGALATRAANYRKQTGNAIAYCVAAAIVDAINKKGGGKKLASWWKDE